MWGDGARIRKMRNYKDLRKLSDRILSWMAQALMERCQVAAHCTSLHEIHAAGYNLVTVPSASLPKENPLRAQLASSPRSISSRTPQLSDSSFPDDLAGNGRREKLAPLSANR